MGHKCGQNWRNLENKCKHKFEEPRRKSQNQLGDFAEKCKGGFEGIKKNVNKSCGLKIIKQRSRGNSPQSFIDHRAPRSKCKEKLQEAFTEPLPSQKHCTPQDHQKSKRQISKRSRKATVKTFLEMEAIWPKKRQSTSSPRNHCYG